MTDNTNSLFLADVRKFTELTMSKIQRVARQSIEDVIYEAQTPVAKGGSMPVDTGSLRNSVIVLINGTQKSSGSESAGKDSDTSLSAVTVALANFQIGDILSFVWTAEYALRQHYGFVGDDALGRTYNQAGYMWRDKAAQNWAKIVRKNAGQVK
jgi:hypothetical protein